jgi:hypothetical protein
MRRIHRLFCCEPHAAHNHRTQTQSQPPNPKPQPTTRNVRPPISNFLTTTSPPLPLQQFGPFIYASAHWRLVDGGTKGTYAKDGFAPVKLPQGWEIAPGEANDTRVCGAHPWQSSFLVFANGDFAGTSACSDPSYIGILLLVSGF